MFLSSDVIALMVAIFSRRERWAGDLPTTLSIKLQGLKTSMPENYVVCTRRTNISAQSATDNGTDAEN